MGHAEAAFELARLDTDPGRRNARLHAAAAGGSHRAMLKLGDEARATSAEAAAGWYRQAADAGNGRAAASIGRLVEAGRLPASEGPAARWFARAEALDCPWWSSRSSRPRAGAGQTVMPWALAASPNSRTVAAESALPCCHAVGRPLSTDTSGSRRQAYTWPTP